MQVNYHPYIPIIAGSISYGLGLYWTKSHLGALVMAVTTCAQCVFIYIRELDQWMSEEKRRKTLHQDALCAFKFSLINYAVCLDLRHFSIPEGIKFLSCCLIFSVLIPMYADYFMSQMKLETLRKCVLEKVQIFLNEYRHLEVSGVEKKFFESCLKDVDCLLNEISTTNSYRINSLGKELVNKINLLIRSSGRDAQEFQLSTFMLKVDGRMRPCFFNFDR